MMLVGSSVRISSVGCESADRGGSSIPFRTTITYHGAREERSESAREQSSVTLS